ncbi:MAG TPA: hypothetical protein PLO51_02025 [Candidatus Micrarchaeota archaeon]|nr:hypothetical protein [Candidatus Micrarchaeota archaeon]
MELPTNIDYLKAALQAATVIFSLVIMYSLFKLAQKHRKESMSKTYYFMAIAFLVFSALQIVDIVAFLPGFPWDIMKLLTELVFMVTVYYSVRILSKTIAAYDFLRTKQKKIRDAE